MEITPARKDNAEDLAYLINLAGEGIPEYLWAQMADGQQRPLEVGTQRAAREEGGFSYTNARVIEGDEGVAGMIIAYQLEDPYRVGNLEEYPAVVRPLVTLESTVPGSWYINAVATRESQRGKGVATQLLKEAEAIALANGVKDISLIVASENTTAKQLYIKLGYRVTASLPVVDYPGCMHGGAWELMVKPLSDLR